MWKLSKSKIEPPRCFQERVLWQGAEPNSTFRVGADGETGACKGLTMSNSSPVLLRKPGLFLESRRCGLGCHAKRHDPPLRCWSFPHIRCPAAGVPNSPKYAAIRNRCGSPKIAAQSQPLGAASPAVPPSHHAGTVGFGLDFLGHD